MITWTDEELAAFFRGWTTPTSSDEHLMHYVSNARRIAEANRRGEIVTGTDYLYFLEPLDRMPLHINENHGLDFPSMGSAIAKWRLSIGK